MDGYIKIHRKIRDWEWYREPNTKAVFLELLFRANYKSTRFMGKEIPRGSVALKISDLCESLNLSRQQVRTALYNLKSTGEINHRATNKYTIVDVLNYDVYQDHETVRQPSNNQPTTPPQPSNNQPIEEERKKEINSFIVNVVRYLNEKAGKDFKATTESTRKHISARFSEGRTLEQFKMVIDKKCLQWLGTDSEQYLRPSTLFTPDHFESYLNQPWIKPRDKNRTGKQSQAQPQGDASYDLNEIENMINRGDI